MVVAAVVVETAEADVMIAGGVVMMTVEALLRQTFVVLLHLLATTVTVITLHRDVMIEEETTTIAVVLLAHLIAVLEVAAARDLPRDTIAVAALLPDVTTIVMGSTVAARVLLGIEVDAVQIAAGQPLLLQGATFTEEIGTGIADIVRESKITRMSMGGCTHSWYTMLQKSEENEFDQIKSSYYSSMNLVRLFRLVELIQKFREVFEGPFDVLVIVRKIETASK